MCMICSAVQKDPMIDFGLRDSVGEHKQRKHVEKQLRPRPITIKRAYQNGRCSKQEFVHLS